MAYEIFSRKVRKLRTPAVTVTKLGRLAFNKAATAPFEKNGVDNVFLMWDAERRQIAVRPTNKKDPRAYTVTYGRKGNGAGFSAKTFFDYIEFDYSESRSMTAEWNDQEMMFEIKVPEDFLANRRQQVMPLGMPKRQAKPA
jgi:hypothetical protein